MRRALRGQAAPTSASRSSARKSLARVGSPRYLDNTIPDLQAKLDEANGQLVQGKAHDALKAYREVESEARHEDTREADAFFDAVTAVREALRGRVGGSDARAKVGEV